MKYGIINPAQQTGHIVDTDMPGALSLAGLTPGKVDHGSVFPRTMAIVVDEFGLFQPTATQHYFAIEKKVYAGAAVLYAINEAGYTIDLFDLPDIRWFKDAREVAYAIELEEVTQPCIRLGEEVLWVWPQPAPAGMMPPHQAKPEARK